MPRQEVAIRQQKSLAPLQSGASTLAVLFCPVRGFVVSTSWCSMLSARVAHVRSASNIH